MGKGRAPCCDKSQVKKGPWSPQEDLKLIAFIQKHGHENWRSLPKLAGLMRCGKSCRLRWINYLRPDVKRGNFSLEEEESIIRLHKALGNKWSKIASLLPGRTDNEIKNVWNTHLKKRVAASKTSGSTSADDESKMESSITSPSSSSSESFFSNETPPPNVVAAAKASSEEQVTTTMAEKIDQDSGKQVPNEVVGITEEPKGSLEPPTLNYQGPYDFGNTTLEEVVDKPNHVIEIPYDPDYDFWKMLDSLEIESFPSTEVQIGEEAADPATTIQGPSFGDAEASMWAHEFENHDFGEETKEPNKKEDQFLPKGDYEGVDPFDLDFVTRPEPELVFKFE